VTREDQQMINAFSRHNMHHVEMTEKLTELKKQLDDIGVAEEEISMMLEDDVKVPVKLGEVFVHFEQDATGPYLDALKDKLTKQISELDAKSVTTKETMTNLKARLYSKFGNSINLEADESSK